MQTIKKITTQNIPIYRKPHEYIPSPANCYTKDTSYLGRQPNVYLIFKEEYNSLDIGTFDTSSGIPNFYPTISNDGDFYKFSEETKRKKKIVPKFWAYAYAINSLTSRNKPILNNYSKKTYKLEPFIEDGSLEEKYYYANINFPEYDQYLVLYSDSPHNTKPEIGYYHRQLGFFNLKHRSIKVNIWGYAGVVYPKEFQPKYNI